MFCFWQWYMRKERLKCTILGIHGLYQNSTLCPTVFICHFHLTVLSFSQGKNQCVFQNIIFPMFFYSLKMHKAEILLRWDCIYYGVSVLSIIQTKCWPHLSNIKVYKMYRVLSKNSWRTFFHASCFSHCDIMVLKLWTLVGHEKDKNHALDA